MLPIYISGQLGTNQLGLAQLGQFKKKTSTGITIDGSNTAPLPLTITALSAGAALSPGDAIVISGNNRAPLALKITALSPGVLIDPGLKSARIRGRGFWPWAPTELARRLLWASLETRDDLEESGH